LAELLTQKGGLQNADVRLKTMSKSQLASFSEEDLADFTSVIICFDVAAAQRDRPLRFFHNAYLTCRNESANCVIVGVNDETVSSGSQVYWEVAHRSKFAESRIEEGPAQQAPLFSWHTEPSIDQLHAICTELCKAPPKLKISKLQAMTGATSAGAAANQCQCAIIVLMITAIIVLAIYFTHGGGSVDENPTFKCVPNKGGSNIGNGGKECDLNVSSTVFRVPL
jgi:hypothetical protein